MDGQAEQPSRRLPLVAELAVMEAPMELTAVAGHREQRSRPDRHRQDRHTHLPDSAPAAMSMITDPLSPAQPGTAGDPASRAS